MGFDIGAASVGEVGLIGEWAHEEGWNPGRSDALAFGPVDPGGCLVGRLDSTPVACVSAIRYGAGFGFIGFYIARPEVRGQGYGIQLWHAGMRRLSDRLVGLDGVVDQQDNYRRSGFVRAWNNVRYEGSLSPVDDTRLVDARTIPFEQIAAYDRRFFPEPRDTFLSTWIGLPDRTALVALQDNIITGFGVRRDARGPGRIGPLYADSPRTATALLGALSAGNPVVVDVPDANPAAVRLVEEAGFTPTFEAARMYTGPAPDIDLNGLFGITTLELG
ncbi:GNAT family N-acetyltransferase [Actinokineospora globicatena]|uniref:GNAT family N-acetyltransferase n=1 Tax=Actinokineospora globicatena TaxID=103729 RepID=UPI0020A3D224|nr:GNAT family N-acetyltransferase [Actinokineospora globicatena]MCP2305904.1 Acetyltransferase (GNAT) family [Actinokineospora globicatena]GLW80227.1 acetyltransferase [Actinokineospora globicatena]GLW87056.1 acetyltransferase [Actinokineospora globicatena]